MRPAPLSLALAAVVAVSLGGCGGPKIARRPSPPPKAPWTVQPEADVKEWKNAHDYKGAPLCQRCHVSQAGKLRAKEPDLCHECHPGTTMTHVGKIQDPPPATLPVEEGEDHLPHVS